MEGVSLCRVSEALRCFGDLSVALLVLSEDVLGISGMVLCCSA